METKKSINNEEDFLDWMNDVWTTAVRYCVEKEVAPEVAYDSAFADALEVLDTDEDVEQAEIYAYLTFKKTHAAEARLKEMAKKEGIKETNDISKLIHIYFFLIMESMILPSVVHEGLDIRHKNAEFLAGWADNFDRKNN